MDTIGAPPAPRYGHTMNFFEEGNYLIIHGGRSDKMNDSIFYNDTYLLELSRLQWINVDLCFEDPKMQVYSRYGHAGIISGNII